MTDATYENHVPEPAPEQPLDRGNPLDLIYLVFFHPVSTFGEIAEAGASNRDYVAALFSVLLVSALLPILNVLGGGNLSSLAVHIPISLLGGVFMWAAMAGLISLLAYAFTTEARARVLLVLTGLATLPWILGGPAVLLKVGLGGIGTAVSNGLVMLIWLWTVVLFGFAVGATYRMPFERVMIVLAMPFLMACVSLFWLGGFAMRVAQMMP